MASFRNLTNEQIIARALAGDDAQTTTGNMSTEHAPYFLGSGHMPKAHADLMRSRREHVSQIIYSYATPIAWRDREYGWIIPDVSYSITTSSKHQTHLYRLGGTRLSIPRDATLDDAQRVLSGELVFTQNSSGQFTGTKPGPNYKAA